MNIFVLFIYWKRSLYDGLITKLNDFLFFQLKKLTIKSSKPETSLDEQDASLPRRHSQKDIKSSLSTLSFGGHDSFASDKRHSLRSNSSVMGRIKDRAGIPV